MHPGEHLMPATAPSMVPCWSAGSTSPSDIETGVTPSRSIATVWKSEANTRIFLPLLARVTQAQLIRTLSSLNASRYDVANVEGR
jgi:hypothetical protein